MALKFFLLTAFCCWITLWTCAQQPSPASVQIPTTSSTYVKARFAIQPIPAEANTWGFEIYVDGKRLIRQASIPSLPGNRGFATQDKAQKAAQLMVDKFRNGQMPPSLTKEEMQKANVL